MPLRARPTKENKKSRSESSCFFLCGFPQPLLDDVGHPGDEFPIGGLAFFRADGIAEVAVQGIPVASGPGDFNQMPDSPLHTGGGGVEHDGQLGIKTEGDGVYRNIGGIKVLYFIGLFIV